MPYIIKLLIVLLGLLSNGARDDGTCIDQVPVERWHDYHDGAWWDNDLIVAVAPAEDSCTIAWPQWLR